MVSKERTASAKESARERHDRLIGNIDALIAAIDAALMDCGSAGEAAPAAG
jgi:hypothetical protein